MKTQLLFIQGAGEGAHAADKILADNLQEHLGVEYRVHVPRMKNEDDASYQSWSRQIQSELKKLKGSVILVGHSVGASVLLKFMSEESIANEVKAIFLIAPPFWGGDGWKYDGYEKLELHEKPLLSAPLYFYQSTNDETVPFEHLALYKKQFPNATFRTIQGRGHQLNNDLTEVAEDISAVIAVSSDF